MGIEAAKVCWERPEELRHVQTWKPKGDAMMTTAARRQPAQVDIYSHERGAIIERLTTGLHPHAPWRDPREISAGKTWRVDNTPFSNTLAGACVWLRKNTSGQHDVSGDLLWCIVMQEHCDAEAEHVSVALKHAWLDMHTGVAMLGRTPTGLRSIERAAAILVSQCVTGIPTKRKIPVQWKQWKAMHDSGERMLWGLVDRAARRAVAALR